MAKRKQAQNKSTNDYHCLKIVECFVNDNKNDAKKHITKLAESYINSIVNKEINIKDLI